MRMEKGKENTSLSWMDDINLVERSARLVYLNTLKLEGTHPNDAGVWAVNGERLHAAFGLPDPREYPDVRIVPGPNHGPRGDVLVVAGGVAANQAIGAALGKLAGEEGFVTRIPPPRLCTDNAAMIAWAGVERLSAGRAGDALGTSPKARWPLAAPA